ncbi:unnamed protein product [Notodromas monacha]|uniref:MARVEL domain-containing protein n=1 Tax=Notodromas monacha TaxID=399045 RepID=A0A7R9BM70_9CRUS|nr:unnamed protein product [Notodromas monacha]CAG0917226.1 unnamed protein product [Notodromas monacha]
MSHTMTVRTTRTTTSTSFIVLNTGHFKTGPGILKLLETLIGATIIGIVAYYFDNYRTSSQLFVPEVFMLIVAVAALVTTFSLLVSCLLSIPTAGIMPTTMFESMWHFIIMVLYVAASVEFLTKTNNYRGGYSGNTRLDAYLAAAVSDALFDVKIQR